MEKGRFDIPVVMIIFKRYETTQRLLKVLEEVRPKTLYLIADAAREGEQEEAEKVRRTRQVADQICWECEVHHIYAEKNMGCDQRIISGLSQVFQEVEQAIILEDDCLPEVTFFPFCAELLEKYKGDDSIFYISGNHLCGTEEEKTSYIFSQRGDTWGWATWSSSWQYMRSDFEKDWLEIKQSGRLQKSRGKKVGEAFIRELEHYLFQSVIPWDYKWHAYTQAYQKLVIVPGHNLVKNIGFGKEATHTADAPGEFSLETRPMRFPLITPKEKIADKKYDTIRQKEIFDISLLTRIKRRLVRWQTRYRWNIQ